MWTICVALFIIDVLAPDHGGTFLIKTKEGKTYLAESGKHNYFGDSVKHESEKAKSKASGSDSALR